MTNPFVWSSTYKENKHAREKKRKEGYSEVYLNNRDAYRKKQARSR